MKMFILLAAVVSIQSFGVRSTGNGEGTFTIDNKTGAWSKIYNSHRDSADVNSEESLDQDSRGPACDTVGQTTQAYITADGGWSEAECYARADGRPGNWGINNQNQGSSGCAHHNGQCNHDCTYLSVCGYAGNACTPGHCW